MRLPCSGVRPPRSEEHTSELQSRGDLVCRLLLEKKKESLDRVDRFAVCRQSRRFRHPALFDRDIGKLRAVLHPRHHLPCDLFLFNDTATTEIYTLSLHDALPI